MTRKRNKKPTELKPDIRELWHLPGLDTCLLCGGKPYIGGIFYPDEENKNLYPHNDLKEGKMRTFLYTLCKICFENPDSMRMVEITIMGKACSDQIIPNCTEFVEKYFTPNNIKHKF